MNVSRDMKKLFICFYPHCFKHRLKQRTYSVVFHIVIFCISILYSTYGITNSPICYLFNKKMIMIVHKAKSYDLNVLAIRQLYCRKNFFSLLTRQLVKIRKTNWYVSKMIVVNQIDKTSEIAL